MVEIIVVLALIGIISIPLVNILGTSNNISNSSIQLMDANNIALIAEEYIKENIRFASHIKIVSADSEPNSEDMKELVSEEHIINTIYKQQGEIIHNNRQIITNGMLMKMNIDLKFSKKNKNVIKIEVRITDKDKQLIKALETEIQLHNLLEDGEIRGEEGNAIIFITYN